MVTTTPTVYPRENSERTDKMKHRLGVHIRFLTLTVVATLAWIGCGVAFIGTQQIRDACDYAVQSARICPGDQHRYALQGICWPPQGPPLFFEASLRYDEDTGQARETISGFRVGDSETREATTSATCNRDPFLLSPASTCLSLAVDASWIAEVPFAFQVPVASGLISPLQLIGHDLQAGCGESAPPPPPPPHKAKVHPEMVGPIGQLTLLQITSPVESQVFTDADASFQLAVQVLGKAPAALDIEWEALEGRLWSSLLVQSAVDLGSLPITVPLTPSQGAAATLRVRVRVAGNVGAETPWRTFQVVDAKYELPG